MLDQKALRFIDLPGANPGSTPGPLASAAVIAGDLVYVSGLRATDLSNARAPLPEFVEAQVEQIVKNLDLILAAAGVDPRRLISARGSVIDFDRLYPRVVAAWSKCMTDASAPAPAFSCVGVSRLARGALVEFDFVLAK